jgi:hypothetical protein
MVIGHLWDNRENKFWLLIPRLRNSAVYCICTNIIKIYFLPNTSKSLYINFCTADPGGHMVYGWVCGHSFAGVARSNLTSPGAWMSRSCECCVLSGRGFSNRPITHPEESYQVCMRLRARTCVCVCVCEWERGSTRVRSRAIINLYTYNAHVERGQV